MRHLLQVTAAVATLSLAALNSTVARADLSTTIAQVKPSIVMVGAYLETASPRFTLLGTGFAVGASLVATNLHVVQPAGGLADGASLAILQHDGDGRDHVRLAQVHSRDDIHDLALLRTDGPPLAPLALGDSEALREGAAIAFTGFPIGAALGFSPVTHRGIVAAVTSIAPPSPNASSLDAKRVRAIKSGTFRIFQLDATAYPGNSGGPVYDPTTGRVLGIINMVFVKGTRESALSQPSGISYAIPAHYLKPMVAEASDFFTESTGRR